MKLAVLFTGGKDSTSALHLTREQGHEVTCLITVQSNNPNSYMFHTPAIEITALQAEAVNLPIIIGGTAGEKEKELVDLESLIKKAREKFEFEGLVTGAIYSEYQSSRIEKVAQKMGLKTISPLWHKKQERHMQDLLDNKFKIIFTAIAAEGLDQSWLNKIITTTDLDKLKELNKKIGLHPAGEGGEFESLVVDCPLFEKKIEITKAEKMMENSYTGRLLIKEAKLVKK